MYAGALGAPLFCDTPAQPLTYSPHTTPFIAVPVKDIKSGKVVCGDFYLLRFSDGTTITARAYDAGPLSLYCVMQPDGTCPPIYADVPRHLWPVEGISGWVEVSPISQWARKWGLNAQ